MSLLSMYGSLIATFVFAFAIIYSFTLLGHFVRLRMPRAEWSAPIAVLWDTYIGIVSAAILTTILGMLGFFNPLVFAGVLAAGPLLNIRNRDGLIAPWRAMCDFASAFRGQKIWGGALLACFAIVGIPTALPEIFYDALYYHLGLPWQYVMAGKIEWQQGVVHSAFPAYLDVLFGLCLGLGGPGVAKCFNLLLFIIGCGAVTAFVDEVLGEKRAVFVGAVAITTIPGVLIMSTMCAIDSALIGFAAMSALALSRIQHCWTKDMCALALQGAMCAGLVAGSKYTGLWLVGALALSIFVGRNTLFTVRAAALFSGCALLVASPWYVRNMIVIGDPIYPVLSGYLGDGDARWAIERIQRDVPAAGLSMATIIDLVVGLVKNQNRFGAGAQPGLLMPLGFVALIVGAWKVPRLRPWAAAAAIYGVIWVSLSSVIRYIYPIYPFCALGIAWAGNYVLAHMRWSSIGMAVLFMVALVPLPQAIQVLDSLYVGSDVLALASGGLTKDEYLSRRLAYYPAVQWINTQTQPETHILYLGETRLLYLDRPVMFSSAYDRAGIERLLAPGSQSFVSQLRSVGITHILIHGREIERLRAAYDYLHLTGDEEQRLRAALAECRIVFRKSGVQVCELPPLGTN